MFKKIVFIMVALVLTSAVYAADVDLLVNPYQVTSLRLQTLFYQKPMAHPSLTIQTINVDAKKQRVLHFSDVVSDQEKALKIMATYSQAYFTKKLIEENLPKENFDMRAELIKTGTAPLSENYQHWNIHSQYLEITFDRAQVEPSYYGIQIVDVPLSLLADVLNPTLFPEIFRLEVGDLLFQDLACGDLCDGVNSTTYGYQHTSVSHVGMVVSLDQSQPMMIEAVSAGVKLTPLDEFLLRSTDPSGHPRTMVGRVDVKTAALIPAAIQAARHDLGASYNATFSPTGTGFYCSQLITQSFFEANHEQTVFALHPMNFKLEKSNQFSPAWVQYFAELKQPIPQGKPGNNPGRLSRDPHISIVYFYGQLHSSLSH